MVTFIAFLLGVVFGFLIFKITKNKLNSLDFKPISKQNFQSWNDALQTREPRRVAELYFDNATFLPTLSGKLKTCREHAVEYFESFLLNNPKGEITEDVVNIINEKCYVHSGLYNFEIGEQNSREIVEARFTFVWGKNKHGIWKILCHHSSVLPKK